MDDFCSLILKPRSSTSVYRNSNEHNSKRFKDSPERKKTPNTTKKIVFHTVIAAMSVFLFIDLLQFGVNIGTYSEFSKFCSFCFGSIGLLARSPIQIDLALSYSSPQESMSETD